jgi:O-antigen/teichoic acid export membrane protein
VELAERGARVTLLTLLPAAILLVAFAEPGLKLWLGSAYSPDAGPVLRWLALAVYVNSVGHAPYFLLQSGVDARAVAFVHLIELPIYYAALFAAATWLGVEGVAIVWFARMAIDSAVMWTIVHRRMPAARDAVLRVARLAIACLLAVALAALWGATRS